MPTTVSKVQPTSVQSPSSTAKTKKSLPRRIAAAEAKANFLKMVATVDQAGEYVITKRGQPVAKLVPFTPAPAKDIYGCMAGTVTILGDIMEPLPPEEWGSLY